MKLRSLAATIAAVGLASALSVPTASAYVTRHQYLCAFDVGQPGYARAFVVAGDEATAGQLAITHMKQYGISERQFEDCFQGPITFGSDRVVSVDHLPPR